MSVSTGTITITYCMPPNVFLDQSFGRICICYFGFRWRAVRDKMARRELQCPMADRALWLDAPFCGFGVFHSDEGACSASRSILTIGDFDWKRSKRARECPHLPPCYSSRIRLAQGRVRVLRVRCGDVALARPADREGENVECFGDLHCCAPEGDRASK